MYIESIEPNDLIFLYSNGIGIIARGIASGICEIKDFNGDVDEKYYMELDRFNELSKPLNSSEITQLLNKQIIFSKAEKKIDYEDGIKI